VIVSKITEKVTEAEAQKAQKEGTVEK